jgi:hypothetical protein
MIGTLTQNISKIVQCPESLEQAQLRTELMIMTGFPYKYVAPIVIGNSIKHSTKCTKENKLNCPFESGRLNNLDSYSDLT